MLRLETAGNRYPCLSFSSTYLTYSFRSSWSWSEGKCIKWTEAVFPLEGKDVPTPKVTFVPPGNPFYFVKQWGEGLQKTFAFTPQVREQVSLSQAKERLAEAAYALKKDHKAGVKAAISDYIWAMQNTMADVSREGFSEGAKQEIAKLLSEESVEQNLLLTKLSAWAKEEMDEIIQTATSMPILGVDKASYSQYYCTCNLGLLPI